MVLQDLWFGLVAVLWAGFFLLEGFDLGVGMLLPFVAHDDEERRIALGTITPVWDGNEVWLLVAGGATFAAFPEWYASAFAGLYLALALVLAGLILRGIGIEYRGKVATEKGRAWCDRALFVGSLLPSVLLGVAFANFVRGLQMNAAHVVTGGFWDLLSPYALLGGLVTTALFAFHGSVFLQLRTEGPVREQARKATGWLAVPLVVLAVGFFVASFFVRGDALTVALSIVIAVAVLAAIELVRIGREGWAFAATGLASVLVPVFVFASLWPDVLPARNNPAWSLTVRNASSSHYTLKVMTVVALIMTPVVLGYQIWTYWVFRARVTGERVTPLAERRAARTSANEAYRVSDA
ncbi:MAG TPA: cytochrome d ubiquinol oxidase subunit II [Acidimicrobiales bacterium]|nr:cytochrome d ubiquinol oxidase subunit II [Acidimicrobiales bacterium]